MDVVSARSPRRTREFARLRPWYLRHWYRVTDILPLVPRHCNASLVPRHWYRVIDILLLVPRHWYRVTDTMPLDWYRVTDTALLSLSLRRVVSAPPVMGGRALQIWR